MLQHVVQTFPCFDLLYNTIEKHAKKQKAHVSIYDHIPLQFPLNIRL